MRHMMQNTWLGFKGDDEEYYPEHLLQRCGRKRKGKKRKKKYREAWLKGFNCIISEYGCREEDKRKVAR